MSGSIWNGSQAITSTANADNSYKAQRFVATEGQTIFVLSAFAYAVGTGSLLVTINGVDQFIGEDFTETDLTTVTLTSPVIVGTKVTIRGLIGTTGATAASVSAAAAAASASAASASALASANSAIDSSGFATASAASAVTSSGFATNSSNSATASANSATAANNSAIAAAASAVAAGGGVTEYKSANFTAVAGHKYAIDTSGGSRISVTLPASFVTEDSIVFYDQTNNWNVKGVDFLRNGNRIMNLLEDMSVDTKGLYFTLIAGNATKGWAVR
jgi:hypothetical protein